MVLAGAGRWLRLWILFLVLAVIVWAVSVVLPLTGPAGSLLYVAGTIFGVLFVVFFILWIVALIFGRDRSGGRGPLV